MLLATVVACAALLGVPGAGPHGAVLDLVSNGGPGPLPAADLGPTPKPVASAASDATATAAPSPDPVVAAARLAPKSARTLVDVERPKAPALDLLVGYVWPLAHPRLTLPFGPTAWGTRVVNGNLFHDGVDLATFCGDRIGAAHSGTVLAAGRKFDAFMGWIGDLTPYLDRLDAKGLWITLPIVVVIDDGNGYRSVYAHFGRLVVKKGQQVHAGQLLGYEGATGHATGCHLHYDLFSPFERDTFGIDPGVVKRMLVPKEEIARVDPLLVLPPKPGINAPATPAPTTGAPRSPTGGSSPATAAP